VKIKAGARAILGNGWEISTAGVSGDTRIEIKSASGYFVGGEQSILKEQGVFFERIAFRDRAFIPTGADELNTFERVVKAKPVVDLFEKGAKGEQARLVSLSIGIMSLKPAFG